MTVHAPIRTALLLAAGVGSRLGEEHEALPKCLLEVGGASILQRMVSALRGQGITRLVIVVGYRQALVREAAAALANGLQVEFLVNDDFATTNNVVSLWLARKHLHEPFLLLESDLVFDPALLAGMMAPDRIAISELRPWMHGTRVALRDDRGVQSFRFPPFGGDEDFKTVNIYSLSAATWAATIAALERFIDAGKVGVYYEHALAELLEQGAINLEAVPFPVDRWYEVDTRADLAQANRLFPSGQDL